MVAASTDDGQQLVALNEVYIGHRTHQSARYRLSSADNLPERQSSSGILVGTGTGSTGWCRSAWQERRSPLALPSPTDPELLLVRPRGLAVARNRHRQHRGPPESPRHPDDHGRIRPRRLRRRHGIRHPVRHVGPTRRSRCRADQASPCDLTAKRRVPSGVQPPGRTPDRPNRRADRFGGRGVAVGGSGPEIAHLPRPDARSRVRAQVMSCARPS